VYLLWVFLCDGFVQRVEGYVLFLPVINDNARSSVIVCLLFGILVIMFGMFVSGEGIAVICVCVDNIIDVIRLRG